MKITKFIRSILLCALIGSFGCRSIPRIGPVSGLAREGDQKIRISLDWKAMMAEAPELDPAKPCFDEDKALFWQKTISETCAGAIKQSREEFRNACMAIFEQFADSSFSDDIEGFVEIENRLAIVPVSGEAEVFVKDFLLDYLRNSREIAYAMQDLEIFLGIISNRSKDYALVGAQISLSKRELARFNTSEGFAFISRLNERAIRMRQLIYMPVVSLGETKMRKRGWQMLEMAKTALQEL